MKKLLLALTLVFMVFVLVACGGKKTVTVTFNSMGGSSVASVEVAVGDKINQPTAPRRTGYTFKGWFKEENHQTEWKFSTDTVEAAMTLYAKWEVATEEEDDETPINLNGIDFVIMVDNAERADPRKPTYERLFKQEKTERINYVEEKYNINVVFRTYPSNASWGGARERWIISQTEEGNPPHVFEIVSTSIGTLAERGVISPLDAYISKYGNKGFWPEKASFSKVNGKTYGYDDGYNIMDNGIYYNSDLLASVLGNENKLLPTELWLDGEWTWAKFDEIARLLKDGLDHTRPAEDGGPQYVLGGRTYNWAYGMIGTNGGQLVSQDFRTHLTSEPVIDTLNFLHNLYAVEGMWRDESPLENTVEPEFKSGNIVFHYGESWYPTVDSKWKGINFDLNFVPYPAGPNAGENLENYRINNVAGATSHVISSFYDKANIPEGYEDLMIHDETIFRIWSDMQYFQPLDEETGSANIEPIKEDFEITRLFPNYASSMSIEAHLSVFDRSRPDFFYVVDESKNHNEEAYMIKIQSAIREGDVRSKMEAIEAALQAALSAKYKLPPNHFD